MTTTTNTEAPPVRPVGSKAIVTGNQHYAGTRRTHSNLWNQDFWPGSEVTICEFDSFDGSYRVSPQSPGGFEWVDALDLADAPEPWQMPLWECAEYRIQGTTPEGRAFDGHIGKFGSWPLPWRTFLMCDGSVVIHGNHATSQAAKKHVADTLRGL